MTSWKTEFATMHHGAETWASNALRFATREEANRAGAELLSRWYVPHAFRAVECDEPVSYTFPEGASRAQPIEKGNA